MRDVLLGLAAPRKAIPARWFYDSAGSELFERITAIPEYPVARLERAILARCADELARLAGPGRVVVELGSGSSAKTPLVLDVVAPSAYVPIDISGEFLRASVAVLEDIYPDLDIMPVEADFMRPLRLPSGTAAAPKLAFFPGSTIGNLVHSTAVDLLRNLAAALGPASLILIGVDGIASEDSMVRAYDDIGGVTAEFNLNLLRRINRELTGTIPIGAFEHRAIWNEGLSRIEMHLAATRDVEFEVSGHGFCMRAGETIHTENSHKYDLRCGRQLLSSGGWSVLAGWTDPDERYAVYLAEVAPVVLGP